MADAGDLKSPGETLVSSTLTSPTILTMCFNVYVLQNEKGKLYIGQTSDLKRRLEFHRQGLSPYTAKHRPWKLVYAEKHGSRSEAMSRERYLKTGAGRDWLARKLAEREWRNGRSAAAEGLKIPRGDPCEFDSHLAHHI